jgi:HEAT repeat protein
MRWIRRIQDLLAGRTSPPDARPSVRVVARPERVKREPRYVGDDLLPLLLECASATPEQAPALTRALRDALDAIPPQLLPAADTMVRREMLWWARDADTAWMRSPADMQRIPAHLAGDLAVLGVMAMHPSGYVREAAVERLAAQGDGRTELPILLVRAHDWVDPIRRRADAAALARLTVLVPPSLELLTLVLRLENGSRRSEAGRRVMDLLRIPEARPVLHEGMRSPDRPTRLQCFAWLAEDDASLADVVREALGSPDPVLRHAAARAAHRLPNEEIAVVARAMVHDRSGRVRSNGAALARRLGREGEPLLIQAAVDVNATVRLVARDELKRRGMAADGAFYREALRMSPESTGALAGLAETAAPEDAEVLERYLSSTRVVLRRIAVIGYAWRKRDDAVPALVRMIADPSPKVSRAAADALRELPVPIADVAALYASSRVHVRRNALRLLVLRGKWDGLVWALRACTDPHPQIDTIGRNAMRRWISRFNRSYAQPTPEQVARLAEALKRARDHVSPKELEWLAALLPPDARKAIDR